MIDIGPYADVNSTLPAWSTVSRVPPEDAYTGGFQIFGARLSGEIYGMTQLDQNFDAAFREQFLSVSEIPEPEGQLFFVVGVWRVLMVHSFTRTK